MTALVVLFAIFLLLFGGAVLVWLVKLLCETTQAVVFGTIGGCALFCWLVWRGAKLCGRATIWLLSRGLPAALRALDALGVEIGLCYLWCAFRLKRWYVRRELRSKK